MNANGIHVILMHRVRTPSAHMSVNVMPDIPEMELVALVSKEKFELSFNGMLCVFFLMCSFQLFNF